MEDKEFEEMLIDVQEEYKKSNKNKDIVIVLLIVLMFLESIFGFGAFVWYESQFDYVTTGQETSDVDISTSGENANAEYNDNDVNGNQYNDNAVHNQGGDN